MSRKVRCNLQDEKCLLMYDLDTNALCYANDATTDAFQREMLQIRILLLQLCDFVYMFKANFANYLGPWLASALLDTGCSFQQKSGWR